MKAVVRTRLAASAKAEHTVKRKIRWIECFYNLLLTLDVVTALYPDLSTWVRFCLTLCPHLSAGVVNG
jgi:hypothetical protein